MSGRLAPIDFVITIGAFILTLGLYKMVKPVLSYASTQFISDEQNRDDFYTVEECSQVESEACCKEAERHGTVTQESMNHCHLCGHPSCVGVTAEQDDPAISLPFKKNIAPIIKAKNRELYDYVNQYARAYATDERDVVPDWYPPITPAKPEESENEILSHHFTKKYGCHKAKTPFGKWINVCYGMYDPEHQNIRLAPPDDPFNEVGRSVDPSNLNRPVSTYAQAYAGIGIDCSTGFKVKPGPNRVARQKWHDDQCKDAYIAGGSGLRVIKPRNDWDPQHPSFHPPLPGRTRELNRTQFPEDAELEYPLGYGEPNIQLNDESSDASISQAFKDETANAYARAYRVSYY